MNADLPSILTQLLDIVSAVAKTDVVAETNSGDLECPFCYGHSNYENKFDLFEHEPDCVVMLARAFMPKEG